MLIIQDKEEKKQPDTGFWPWPDPMPERPDDRPGALMPQRGEKGDPGARASVTIGTVESVEPNEDAEVTNSGTEFDAVLNFKIPKGQTGPAGAQGQDGKDGKTWQDFTPRQISRDTIASMSGRYISGLEYSEDGNFYMLFGQGSGNAYAARCRNLSTLELAASRAIGTNAAGEQTAEIGHVNDMTIVGNFLYIVDESSGVIAVNKNDLTTLRKMVVQNCSESLVGIAQEDNVFYFRAATRIYKAVRVGDHFENFEQIYTVDLGLFDEMDFKNYTSGGTTVTGRTGQGMTVHDGVLYSLYTVRRNNGEGVKHGAAIAIELETGAQQLITFDMVAGDELENVTFKHGWGYIASTKGTDTAIYEFIPGRHFTEKFERHDTGAVSSVNGQTGDVVLSASDVGALPDDTVIPSAYDDTEVRGLINGKANSSHSHEQSDITGLSNALSGKANSSHSHEQSDITGLSTALAGKANSSHSHAQSDITGLSTALAGKANSSHSHAQSDITGLSTALNAKLTTPNGGTDGQVLTKTASGYAWQTPSGGGECNIPIIVGQSFVEAYNNLIDTPNAVAICESFNDYYYTFDSTEGYIQHDATEMPQIVNLYDWQTDDVYYIGVVFTAVGHIYYWDVDAENPIVMRKFVADEALEGIAALATQIDEDIGL